MGTTTNWIAATAAFMALATPLIGTAEARQDRHNGARQSLEWRNDDVRFDRVRRDQRRFDRFGSIATPRINRRIANQIRRIRRGYNRGRLSRFQTARLRSRVFAIRTALRFARFDGDVSRHERRRLNRMLNRNSQRINRKMRFGGDFRRLR